MSDVIRWEEPPASHGNARPRPQQRKFQAAADALRGRPGAWALIVEGKAPGTAGSLAARIKKGDGPWAPAHSFEAKSVGPAGSHSSKVYARYMGEPDA